MINGRRPFELGLFMAFMGRFGSKVIGLGQFFLEIDINCSRGNVNKLRSLHVLIFLKLNIDLRSFLAQNKLLALSRFQAIFSLFVLRKFWHF